MTVNNEFEDGRKALAASSFIIGLTVEHYIPAEREQV
jgi:hypothetical protein